MKFSSGSRGLHRIFHLLVVGHYRPIYWIHIELRTDISLAEIDSFLREIWLECCGHLSRFIIRNTSYMSDLFDEPFGFSDDKTMNVELGHVAKVGTKLGYEYDFGSTTTLELKVLSEREGSLTEEPITILAKNRLPKILCENCQENLATQICSECFYEGEAWLCEDCAATHECGEEILLPVVNSPRTGVCGYTGE